MVKITKCANCRPNDFQDQTYGPKMRVHNRAGANSVTKWRCTCCGNTTEAQSDKKK